MITIKTEYLEEFRNFLVEMGCKIKSFPGTGGEVEYPSRTKEFSDVTHSNILLVDIDPSVYEVEIHSTPGFEQKLLRKGKKRTIMIVGIGPKKPFQISWWPQEKEMAPPSPEEWEKLDKEEEPD